MRRTIAEARRGVVGRPWPARPREHTGRRPVVIWQSNELTSVLHSALVVPLTTNLDRVNLAGAATV